MKIKVGFLAAYDCEYIKIALPFVYDEADSIVIAIDKNRKTWNGNLFHINEAIFDWISQYDRNNKIKIYEDDFYDRTRTPMECETNERNKLANFMGNSGWHIQLDSDEYFVDFKSFSNNLKQINIKKDTSYQIFAFFIPLFKCNETGYFIIDAFEKVPVATNLPHYKQARLCEHSNMIEMPCRVIHQSWARSAKEINYKIKNWGHVNDFDVRGFYKLWDFIDSYNYKMIKDFHPLTPKKWPSISFVESSSINSLANIIDEKIVLNKKIVTYTTEINFTNITKNYVFQVRNFFLQNVLPPIISRFFKL